MLSAIRNTPSACGSRDSAPSCAASTSAGRLWSAIQCPGEPAPDGPPSGSPSSRTGCWPVAGVSAMPLSTAAMSSELRMSAAFTAGMWSRALRSAAVVVTTLATGSTRGLAEGTGTGTGCFGSTTAGTGYRWAAPSGCSGSKTR